MYVGPIEIGMKFLWEPQRPWATQHCKVTSITMKDSDGEKWIGSRAWVSDSKVSGDYTGEEVWNTANRFREAVIRVLN